MLTIFAIAAAAVAGVLLWNAVAWLLKKLHDLLRKTD
jgi:uncharacterized membrane protein